MIWHNVPWEASPWTDGAEAEAGDANPAEHQPLPDDHVFTHIVLGPEAYDRVIELIENPPPLGPAMAAIVESVRRSRGR